MPASGHRAGTVCSCRTWSASRLDGPLDGHETGFSDRLHHGAPRYGPIHLDPNAIHRAVRSFAVLVLSASGVSTLTAQYPRDAPAARSPHAMAPHPPTIHAFEPELRGRPLALIERETVLRLAGRSHTGSGWIGVRYSQWPSPSSVLRDGRMRHVWKIRLNSMQRNFP